MKAKDVIKPKIPVCTYRLQLRGEFKFSAAAAIIPYLNELGISDIYASPYLKAKSGSAHGYDIVDPTEISEELGGESEYELLIKELKNNGMGQIMDIVPNHMCAASSENVYWMDMLENGENSQYAHFFDINWKSVNKDLEHKILIPVLGSQYGVTLENGELQISFEEGAFFVYYYSNKYPLRPLTYKNILTYDINKLEAELGRDHHDFMEFLSIITAITNLPSSIEIDKDKTIEHTREKQIIKRRLNILYNDCTEVKSFIDTNIFVFNGVAGNPRSFDLMDSLLREQVYRLAFWRVATEEINYRRFFDINDLAAIRMEDKEVFNEIHKVVFRLIRQRKVNGLRIDHPDGLFNPVEYFYRLQKRCFVELKLSDYEETGNGGREAEEKLYNEIEAVYLTGQDYRAFYIVGEKIFAKNETMPPNWLISGSTGYAFLNLVNGIFIDTKNASRFDKLYSEFTDIEDDSGFTGLSSAVKRLSFRDITYEKKKLITQVSMSSEINTLGRYLKDISVIDRHTRDFTLYSLTKVITEVIAFFPVYRTYISSYEVTETDRKYIKYAVARAKKRNMSISSMIFDFLENVLLMQFPDDYSKADKVVYLGFVMKFQQITGPVMAKGLEDTAFYIYNRLTSLNEVGGHPEDFGTHLSEFHKKNTESRKYQPYALIATSTHDTKRGEDTRARINVLSEIPLEWEKLILRLNKALEKTKTVIDNKKLPDRNDEYLLYQTLTGTWPIDLTEDKMKTDICEAFKTRIKDYMLKAIREAKVNSSWINPDTSYETALMKFIDNLFICNNDFYKYYFPFKDIVSNCGLYNSLSQVLLKITATGVPDFYQGTELWEFSLVDPDNRRPVDYALRAALLADIKKNENEMGALQLAASLTKNKKDGRIKMYLIYKALNFRKSYKELFEQGEYLPLQTIGANARSICAFARHYNGCMVVVAAPRLVARLVNNGGDYKGKIWGNNYVIIPPLENIAGFKEKEIVLRNIFTGETVGLNKHGDALYLPLYKLFNNFPVAMLINVKSQ
ncbi:MAG: malto-oligosyltrehalose synthase [Nitrospirae bacterium]|nr:malto-oligosyltrehalose synthase [Nitrospirota bacterium]